MPHPRIKSTNFLYISLILAMLFLHLNYIAKGYIGKESDYGIHFAIASDFSNFIFWPLPYFGMVGGHFLAALVSFAGLTIANSMLLLADLSIIALLFFVMKSSSHLAPLTRISVLIAVLIGPIPVFVEMMLKGYFSAQLAMGFSSLLLLSIRASYANRRSQQNELFLFSALFALISWLYPDISIWFGPTVFVYLLFKLLPGKMKVFSAIPFLLGIAFLIRQATLIGFAGGINDYSSCFFVLVGLLSFFTLFTLNKISQSTRWFFLPLVLILIFFSLQRIIGEPIFGVNIPLPLVFSGSIFLGLVSLFITFAKGEEPSSRVFLMRLVIEFYVLAAGVLCLYSVLRVNSISYYPMKNLYWSAFFIPLLPIAYPSTHHHGLLSVLVCFSLFFIIPICTKDSVGGRYRSLIFADSKFNSDDERCAMKLRDSARPNCEIVLVVPGQQKKNIKEDVGEKILRGTAYNAVLDVIDSPSFEVKINQFIPGVHSFWDYGFFLHEKEEAAQDEIYRSAKDLKSKYSRTCLVVSREIAETATIDACYFGSKDYNPIYLVRVR